MQNAYLRPNERTYGIIINGFIAAGLIEESLPLLERMKMEGIPPTVAVFNHLVKGYSEAMQPEGIDKVINIPDSTLTIISPLYEISISFGLFC
jgi:pentatricopeptide repeat protein